MDDNHIVSFWFDRFPVETEVRNADEFVANTLDKEFICNILGYPPYQQMRFVAHMINGFGGMTGLGGGGIYAIPFLNELFSRSSSRDVRYFIVARVAIHFVRMNGKFNQGVYDWLCWAVEELDCRKVAEMMDVIRSRFDDLCDVLDFSALESPEISKARQ